MENSQRDWSGKTNSVYKTLGSSHHAKHDRQAEDYYATEPRAVKLLLELEKLNVNIWECACGAGHLSEVLYWALHNVKNTDITDRGYSNNFEIYDFLNPDNTFYDGDIVTNPPFKFAKQFVEKALAIIPEGNKVCMFLKVQFMEGKGHKNLFLLQPPKTIWVSSSRINCAMNGNFDGLRTSGGSAVAYAWYVWEKGFKGDTMLKWFN